MSYFSFSDCETKTVKLLVSTGEENNVILGHNSVSPITKNYVNCSVFGNNVNCTGSNQVQLGNSKTNLYTPSGIQQTSDSRDKIQIRNTTLGLNFINLLRPVDYKWNFRNDYKIAKQEYEMFNGVKIPIVEVLPNDGSKTRSRYHHGLLAQDVKKIMDELNIDFGGYQDHLINGGDDQLTISYSELIAPMIKAIQELKVEIDLLKLKFNK
jgi:hypothetical protein